MAQIIAAAALVNGDGDILYLHGRSGMFLELSPGEAGINNIVKMARNGLRAELASALHKAVATCATVVQPGLNVKTNGHYSGVKLTVRPVTTGPGATPHSPLYLVVLEESAAAAPAAAGSAADEFASAGIDPLAPGAEAHIAALKAELHAKEESLQSANEELESSLEELTAANEEMQSINEELQSTNEELETSKEELQSVNEELATINHELQTKVADLSRVNNDMNNLFAGTGVGTVFVDHQLRILRFTPAVASIIKAIASDVGRPLSDIAINLVGYSRLMADVQEVLQTLVPREQEVGTPDGRFFTLRILPYRTLDNVIEGAVISFVDISETVVARQALAKANVDLRLAVVVRDAHDAITVHDLEGRTLAWNPGAERLYGWSEAQALQMNALDRIPEPLRATALDTLAQLSRAEVLMPVHTQRLTRRGAVVDVVIVSTALIDGKGSVYAIATTERRATKGAP